MLLKVKLTFLNEKGSKLKYFDYICNLETYLSAKCNKKVTTCLKKATIII